MIEISFPMHINFTIDGEFTLVNIAEKIKNLELEKLVLNQFVENINEIITTELCGDKYQHNKKETQFERAGNYTRKIITLLGESELKIDKIRNKSTKEIFKPILPILGINPYKNSQDDIVFTSMDIATKSSYRDTVYIMENFLKKTLSPSTINRKLIKLGIEIKEFIKNKNKENNEEEYDHFYGDGTKSHSQEDRYKNDIKVAMTHNKKGEKVFLGCNVNKSWHDLGEELDELNVLTPDAVLVSDAEPGLKNALVTAERKYQLDFIHFIRDIGFKLWNDEKLDLDMRKNIKKYVEKIIYKLKNQTLKYAENKKELKMKINEAVDKLQEFSEYLYEIDCKKTASFINKHSNDVVTFAILTVDGKNIPWNSNSIERLMGEIQKRCKHKWMRWTTQGQESLLNLILTRYINPENYEEFKNQKLKTQHIKNIQIKITTT